MYFVGDTHGKTSEFLKLTETLLHKSEPGEPIIQVGDMGAGFTKIPRYHDNVRWIRGNHDDPQTSRMHPNYMGNTYSQGKDWGYDEAYKLFWLAGAWSVDWAWRKASNLAGHPLCWWPDEELSQPELDAALALYIEKKPEIVVSHEAPASIVPYVLAKAGIIIKPGDPLYSERFYRPEKLDCIQTRTSTMLQRMLSHHAPRYWTFGHYHISKQIVIDRTTFKCCAELESYRIVL